MALAVTLDTLPHLARSVEYFLGKGVPEITMSPSLTERGAVDKAALSLLDQQLLGRGSRQPPPLRTNGQGAGPLAEEVPPGPPARTVGLALWSRSRTGPDDRRRRQPLRLRPARRFLREDTGHVARRCALNRSTSAASKTTTSRSAWPGTARRPRPPASSQTGDVSAHRSPRANPARLAGTAVPVPSPSSCSLATRTPTGFPTFTARSFSGRHASDGGFP